LALYNWFSKSLAWTSAVFFALTGAMLTYEVVARYFFTKPTIWAAELSQMCLIWGSLIAMPWMLSARRHITVTAITALLSANARRTLELLSLIIIFVFSVIVAIWGWDIFYDSFERGRTTGSLLNLPIWIVELSVPAGFFMLCIQSVIEFFKVLRHGAPKVEGVHD